MSTLGHPLSDLANLLSPFTFARHLPKRELESRINFAFAASAATPGLPTRFQCIEWYAEVVQWMPHEELPWGDAFGVFRYSVIMQGIAARWALRQASSEKAKEHAAQMAPFGDFAWSLVEDLKEEKVREKAREKAQL